MAYTIDNRRRDVGRNTTGFDYLRIGLSLAVLCFHAIGIGGAGEAQTMIWSGPFRFLPAAILPMFFALSGYLVAGSLERNSIPVFVMLRVIRIVPALAVEVVLSAVFLGLAFSTLPWADYIRQPEFARYFINIIGIPHYFLPGVFEDNPQPRYVNGQLWTIPYELECYLSLVVLAIIPFFKRQRSRLLAVVVASACILTLYSFFVSPANPFDHIPGRALVVAFLAGVAIYFYRDRLPYSWVWGIVTFMLMAVILQFPNMAAFAMVPAAYCTVWLGLTTPRAIPFGDLSYGVFLFHFPIEQTFVRLFPTYASWWSTILVAIPVTAGFAWLSWTLVEKPLMDRKRLLTDLPILATISGTATSPQQSVRFPP